MHPLLAKHQLCGIMLSDESLTKSRTATGSSINIIRYHAVGNFGVSGGWNFFEMQCAARRRRRLTSGGVSAAEGAHMF